MRMKKIFTLIFMVPGILIFAQNFNIGGSKYEVVASPKINETSKSSVKNQQTKIKYIIREFYIHPELVDIIYGEELTLNKIFEVKEKSNSETKLDKLTNGLDKFNNIVENIGKQTVIYFYIGRKPPASFYHNNKPLFGYQFYDGIYWSSSSLGINGQKSRIQHWGGSNRNRIDFGRVEIGSHNSIGLWVAKVEEGYFDPYGRPQKLLQLEKLASTSILIEPDVEYEIILKITNEGWFLEANQK